MNDRYGSIVGGNIHLALEELIGGQSMAVWLQRQLRNKNSFNEEVKVLCEKSYLIDASSHLGSRNDHHTGPLIILYCHAYSLVDVKMLDQHKLICLKTLGL